MSKTISKMLAGAVRIATSVMKPYRRSITRALTSENLAAVVSVSTDAGPIYFQGVTARSLHDPLHLFSGPPSGEPDTIKWLNSLPPNSTLWDIGANIGVFSIYAAKVRRLRVVAFEPSASSYATLVRNVELNRLSDLVDAYCIAFDEKTHLDHLFMRHTGAGHAMHAFGQTVSVTGEINPTFKQSVPGFSIDDFYRLFNPPRPTDIKLDVDSIEEKILRGGQGTIASYVQTIQVEIAGSTHDEGASGIRTLLGAMGFQERPVEAGCRNVVFARPNL